MPASPRILAVGTAVPARRWSQRETYELAARCFPGYRDRRVEHVFMSAEIESRHLAFTPEDFDPDADADALHARFADHALPLAREAALQCLERAGVESHEVDAIVVATCTGYLCPGLSSHAVRALDLRDDVQRTDLVGMGCAGAMPALQRAHDFVRAHPDRRALAITVEICSACWYVDDDLETAVGNAICADGAAAVLVAGIDAPGAKDAAGPELVRFETLLEPALLDSVGFQFRAGKQRIVLSKELRHAAGPLVRRAVERLLERAELDRGEIDRWVIHSGGRSVLDGIDRALEFERGELDESRGVLREFGNMSSPTVLFVLERTLSRGRPAAGERGVMLALGPGLAAETALLRW